MQLRGTIVNSITPMNAQGKVDADGVKKHIEHLVSKKVGGIWFLGSAGEDFSISLQDRLLAARSATKNCSETPLIIGLGTMSYHECKDFIQEFEHKRCDFHILPYDQKLSGSAKLKFLENIAEIPKNSKIWLYHNPKRGSGISVNEAKVLSQHENIRGIKAGGYDLQHLQGMLSLHNDEVFQVYGAGGSQALALYQLGAKAHMTSDANIWPELHGKLYSEFESGNVAEAQKTQATINAMNSLMPKTNNGENCVAEKFILSRLGVCEKYVNPSYQPLTPTDEKSIEKWMQSTSSFQ